MVSVLLATYNDEKYIERAVRSVLEQTYSEIELLIGFNGTTDSSKSIVSTIKDSRIRIFDYGDDKGKSKTLNKLMAESRGEWLAIQDGDDIWLPSKLQNQMSISGEYDVIGTQISYIDSDCEIIGSPVLSTSEDEIKQKSLSGLNQIANSSCIFRKKAAVTIGGWDEDIIGIEDFDFWLRLIRKEYRLINLSTTEVYHRLHSESNFNTKTFDLKKIL